MSAVTAGPYEQRGYLREDFRVFRLADPVNRELKAHYHEFDKLVLFSGGNAAYSVEGRRYILRPGDIVIVGHGQAHRPEPELGGRYDRTIVYISPDFLRRESVADCDLERCFAPPGAHESSVLRGSTRALFEQMAELSDALTAGGLGAELLCRSLMLRFLVCLARMRFERSLEYAPPDDPGRKAGAIIRYINGNLSDDLTIDSLSERFFISKYHMMRMFREDTGFSLHSYISGRRLFMARDLISGGCGATDACFKCGFKSYSSFARAYTKLFGCPPTGQRRPSSLPDAETE